MEQNVTLKEKAQLVKKMEAVKLGVQESGIKKTGSNKFQNYKYFQLEDFLPVTRKLLQENGLGTVIKFNEEMGALTVMDLETGASTRFTHCLPKIEKTKVVKGVETPVIATEQEKIRGALETYARRYLYLSFLELAESDAIDSAPSDEKKKKKTTKKKGKYPSPKEVKERINSLPEEKREEALNSLLESGEITEFIHKKVLEMSQK